MTKHIPQLFYIFLMIPIRYPLCITLFLLKKLEHVFMLGEALGIPFYPTCQVLKKIPIV
jgi:hypothetical protein